MGKKTSQLHSFDRRSQQLQAWVQQQFSFQFVDFQMVSGDASFRRYFRLKHQNGSLIAVDAPPQHENNPAFIGIAKALLDSGLCVPEVFAADLEQGFLAISDLGDVQLFGLLNEETVDGLYLKAMQQLLLIQQTSQFSDYDLPKYDSSLLMKEMHFMTDWFIGKHLSIELTDEESNQLQTLFVRLSELALSQPQITTHCDFHSRNLMLTDDNQIAVIDFQDAVLGAVSYDLISLIKDCYIRWPQSKVDGWLRQFHKMLLDSGMDDLPEVEDFIFLSDAMALQRHIKVVGIFARLYHRDGKASYLDDIPLTLEYILECCDRYQEFNQFGQWLRDRVLTKFNRVQNQLKESK